AQTVTVPTGPSGRFAARQPCRVRTAHRRGRDRWLRHRPTPGRDGTIRTSTGPRRWSPPASSGPPGLNVPQPADQGSAVAAAGAVPTSAVGSHRAPAVPARTAARAGSTHAADPDTQQTVTVTTGPSATAATTSASAPASEAWSFTPPSLQDSTEIPQARGA
ncbi:DNA polymerase III subunit gamma/tau, partial [Actinomyces naeslundii]|uniref:DNA polymerase III subunit gamma/tau n=1 Tax=Actinomyces naeslundii TaxID=1655 RepID=UPI001F420772